MGRPPVIVLDTHAWIFYVSEPDALSKRALRRIEKEIAGRDAWISAMSAWEVAMLSTRGRLRLSVTVEDWIARAESVPGLASVPVDSAIAVRAVALPEEYPADPADRIIAATALVLGADLVTKDRVLRGVGDLNTVW